MPLTNAQKQKDTRARRKAKLERLAVYEAALREIVRRGELCIHQNTGRWNMSVEHDRRSYDIISSNNDIARQALTPTTDPHAGERDEILR